MIEVISSLILYMGNKGRLIRRDLINLFPSKINTFIDVFAGSASVAMNTKAKHYIVNDIDDTLHTYYNIFSTKLKENIISHVKNRVDEFNLPKKLQFVVLATKKKLINIKKPITILEIFTIKIKSH